MMTYAPTWEQYPTPSLSALSDRQVWPSREMRPEGTATRTHLSNDGGIDQDALGLSRIYVQAKRYAPGNTVG